MAPKVITLLRIRISSFFQRIQQTSRRIRFLPCQKRIKKWWKSRVLTSSENHSHTENRPPDGYPKSCKMTPKWIKNHRKMRTKKMDSDSTMVKNARRRLTCENASNYVHFCRSRCCFAHAMDAKIAQNRRKSSMGTCTVSVVVPAARRANSECIVKVIMTIRHFQILNN